VRQLQTACSGCAAANTKSEYRNPKQIQISQIPMTETFTRFEH
jgi:hypothetical protein